jgi:hypothetical protein
MEVAEQLESTVPAQWPTKAVELTNIVSTQVMRS